MEDLREVLRTVHHVRDLARHYGVTVPVMTAELKRQGIIRHTRREDVDWSDLQARYEQAGSMSALARMLGTTERITYKELRARGIQLRPRGHLKGQKKSEAWREASRSHWEDPVWRAEQRRKWLETLPQRRQPRGQLSPLERILHTALIKAGISFTTQQPKLGKYIVDIELLQARVIIEADGHSHILSAEKDAARDAELAEIGYRVFRFRAREINRDPDGCIRSVIEACGLTPDTEPVAEIRNGMVGSSNPRWRGGKQEWTCETCGGKFMAYLRAYGRKPRFCRRKCQSAWQIQSHASVIRRRPRRSAQERAEEIRQRWAEETD